MEIKSRMKSLYWANLNFLLSFQLMRIVFCAVLRMVSSSTFWWISRSVLLRSPNTQTGDEAGICSPNVQTGLSKAWARIGAPVHIPTWQQIMARCGFFTVHTGVGLWKDCFEHPLSYVMCCVENSIFYELQIGLGYSEGINADPLPEFMICSDDQGRFSVQYNTIISTQVRPFVLRKSRLGWRHYHKMHSGIRTSTSEDPPGGSEFPPGCQRFSYVKAFHTSVPF